MFRKFSDFAFFVLKRWGVSDVTSSLCILDEVLGQLSLTENREQEQWTTCTISRVIFKGKSIFIESISVCIKNWFFRLLATGFRTSLMIRKWSRSMSRLEMEIMHQLWKSYLLRTIDLQPTIDSLGNRTDREEGSFKKEFSISTRRFDYFQEMHNGSNVIWSLNHGMESNWN